MRYAVLLLLILAAPVAAEPVVYVYAGANGIWNDAGLPDDFELGGTLDASLSEHISLPVQLYAGLDNGYARFAPGVLVKLSDADQQNFSIGVGVQRQMCSRPEFVPEEWQARVAIGFNPIAHNPKLVLGGEGTYGLETENTGALIAFRYRIGGGAK